MVPRVTTGALSVASLSEGLEAAEWTQADLRRAMIRNREGLACSEGYISKLVNGLKPGPQYQSAINRALRTQGVEVEWPA